MRQALPAAGALDERVTVEAPISTPDGFGGQVDGWTTVVTDWRARVRPLSARDETQTGALTSLSSYEVTLRLAPATEVIRATHRVLWRGLTMRAQGVVIDRERREVRITCDAGPGVSV